MKVKGNQRELTPTGVTETIHETTSEAADSSSPVAFSFLDVLSIDNTGAPLGHAESNALAALVERWIVEHLTSEPTQPVDTARLKAAFAYANQRLLQSDAAGLNQVAVSGVIAIPSSGGKDLVVAGVGDCKVYAVNERGAKEVFADPLNSAPPAQRRPEERLFALNNAVGVQENLVVHTVTIALDHPVTLVATSYGLSQHDKGGPLEKLLTVAAPTDVSAEEILKQIPLGGHHIKFEHYSIQPSAPATSTIASEPLQEKESTPEHNVRRKRQRVAAFTLTAATCALVLGVTAVMLDDDSPKPPTIDESVHAKIGGTSGKPGLDMENNALLLSLQESEKLQKRTIAELTRNLDSSRHRIAELEMVAGGSGDKPLQRQVVELGKQLREKADALAEQEEKQRILKGEVAKSGQRIVFLEKTIDTLENVIDTRSDTGSVAVQEVRQQLKRDAQLAREEIATLQKELTSKNSTISQLKETLARQNETLARFETGLSEASRADGALEGERRRSIKLADRLRTALEELQVKEEALRSTKAEAGSSSEVVERLTQQAKALEDDKKALKREVNDLTEKVNTLETTRHRYEEATASKQSLGQQLATRDALLRDATKALQEQKLLLQRVEDSRRALKRELETVRSNYEEVMTATKTATTPAVIRVATGGKQGPIPVTAEGSTRVHLVSKGETLSGISTKYYGTSRRWKGIYDANRNVVADVNGIRVGTALVIP